MAHQTRRAILAAAGTTLVAGCSSGSGDGGGQNGIGGSGSQDSDGDGVPDSEDDFPNNPEFSEEIKWIDDVRNIPEDEWLAWELDFDGSTELNYEFTVREGPAIDVIMVTQEEYTHLEEGDRYRYIPDGSVLDSTGGSQTVMPPDGMYRLIVDNSSIGEASPPTNFDDDIARVEIEAYARR